MAKHGLCCLYFSVYLAQLFISKFGVSDGNGDYEKGGSGGECRVSASVVVGLEGFTDVDVESLTATGSFGVAPRKAGCRGSFIKLMWLQNLKDRLVLNDEIGIQRYLKCYIMLLFGTILFGDNIGEFNWKSTCLAHLYRSLCRASRFDCKKVDCLLTLLLTWAWIHLSN
ncbi:hypothetical protein Ahy_A07g033377 [Arachis hypogaea]|uniref:Aminotransferase-like plant mobile domain-containing protein n=1 Tax=Arachis hypogaea TaxID=3818 RepID=A0A445C9C2_ARAHY|nr:hypothetical protein Ahy_A07g033377 [Arachis hypogaea]